MTQYRAQLFLLLLALTTGMAACEKDDSKQAFGNTNIYMPQATIAANRYTVPSGLDSATYNYKIDVQNDKVNIILGVSRSGRQDAGAFSVDVAANADTINQLMSSGVLDPAMYALLPASVYSLPQKLLVPDGSTSATFYLSVNKTQLKTYAGRKLALAVLIRNPSAYNIMAGIDKVIVIIDVNALKL